MRSVYERRLPRRSFLAALGLTAAAGLLSACEGRTITRAETAPSAPDEEAPEPFLDAESFPAVDGSTACIPLIAQMMADTTGIPLETAQTAVTVSTTAYAWQNLAVYDDPSVQMLLVYEAPDYVQDAVAASGVAIEQKAVGRDALLFLVNDDHPVQRLTLPQLHDIYTGRITNWKEVGGADAPIVAFQRSEDSGSQTLFKKLLMGGADPMPAPSELAPQSMGGLVDSVAEYSNSANAIGFSVYYYIDQMYSQPGLRLLEVEGVAPSYESIADDSYPLCNEFYAVIRAGAAADSPERQLYDWLSTDAGRASVKKAGYVPA